MPQQCNGCGNFQEIANCAICHMLVCSRCRVNHEIRCSQMQQMKLLGLGPTIRQVGLVEIDRPNPVASAENKIVTDGPEQRATLLGLPIIDNLFTFEIKLPEGQTIGQELKNESVGETILPQEQDTTGVPINQGGEESSERVEGAGSTAGGNPSGEGEQTGSNGDGSSTPVEPVISSSVVAAGDGQTEPKQTS
jgi:hypothetical protein